MNKWRFIHELNALAGECPVLKEMIETGTAVDKYGQPVQIHSQIYPQYAEALYRTVLIHRPRLVIEIGMAFGVSSLAILTALRKVGGAGRLISIDPHQSTQWKGCGVGAVARAKLLEWHELVEEFDYHALPRLLASGCRVDFAYIDGWHTFDHAMLDFWFIDKMMNVGGIVGFNDCIYPAVHKAISFVLTHRHYQEISVGLTPICSRRLELKRFLRGRFSKRHRMFYQDRYFRKTDDWQRSTGRFEFADF